MTEHTPYIDFENLPAPSQGFLVTHFITFTRSGAHTEPSS